MSSSPWINSKLLINNCTQITPQYFFIIKKYTREEEQPTPAIINEYHIFQLKPRHLRIPLFAKSSPLIIKIARAGNNDTLFGNEIS